MHVTITGAGGFIGRRLVQQLLQRGTIVDSAGQAKADREDRRLRYFVGRVAV